MYGNDRPHETSPPLRGYRPHHVHNPLCRRPGRPSKNWLNTSVAMCWDKYTPFYSSLSSSFIIASIVECSLPRRSIPDFSYLFSNRWCAFAAERKHDYGKKNILATTHIYVWGRFQFHSLKKWCHWAHVQTSNSWNERFMNGTSWCFLIASREKQQVKPTKRVRSIGKAPGVGNELEQHGTTRINRDES